MKTFINVTKNRKFYFNVYTSEDRAEDVYNTLKTALPKGYSVSLENNDLDNDKINWIRSLFTVDATDEQIVKVFREKILPKEN